MLKYEITIDASLQKSDICEVRSGKGWKSTKSYPQLYILKYLTFIPIFTCEVLT